MLRMVLTHFMKLEVSFVLCWKDSKILNKIFG
jgi:hypothetical protein